MEPVYIVVLLALIEYFVLGALVARARSKYGISAPAITGSEDFERVFRTHQNTLEALIVFVPAILLFGLYVSPLWGAGLGVVFIIGRAVYAKGYIAAAEKRAPGAGISGAVNMILVVGALIGAIRALVA